MIEDRLMIFFLKYSRISFAYQISLFFKVSSELTFWTYIEKIYNIFKMELIKAYNIQYNIDDFIFNKIANNIIKNIKNTYYKLLSFCCFS